MFVWFVVGLVRVFGCADALLTARVLAHLLDGKDEEVVAEALVFKKVDDVFVDALRKHGNLPGAVAGAGEGARAGAGKRPGAGPPRGPPKRARTGPPTLAKVWRSSMCDLACYA